jgi:hypothetical protein
MSKRVSNKRGKGGARTRVRFGWRKRRHIQFNDLLKSGTPPLVAWRMVYG